MGPIMIVMGINLHICMATTGTMIFEMISSIAVMFVMSGLIIKEYTLYLLFVSLCVAYITGKTRIGMYVSEKGVASILVDGLVTIIGPSTVDSIVILFMHLVKVDWCFWVGPSYFSP